MIGPDYIPAAARENFPQLVLMDLARAFQGRFLPLTVNTDQHKALAEAYGVRSLSSFERGAAGSALALAADDMDEAVQQLMTIVREGPNVGDGLARKGLRAVFSLLDPSDDRVRKYRTELFNLIH